MADVVELQGDIAQRRVASEIQRVKDEHRLAVAPLYQLDGTLTAHVHC